jgi:hypothetical protein
MTAEMATAGAVTGVLYFRRCSATIRRQGHDRPGTSVRQLRACRPRRSTGLREPAQGIHGEQHKERMEQQATALQYALATALTSPSVMKRNMIRLRPMHRTVPAEYFTAFAEALVTTLRTQVKGLPDFVLAASAAVVKRAAEHIAARP